MLGLLCLFGYGAVHSAALAVGSTAGMSAEIESLFTGHPRKHHRRLHHVTSAMAQRVNTRTAVHHLGGRLDDTLPEGVMAMVRAEASGQHDARAGFDDASIEKARKILNKMMTDARKRLDEVIIDCREYQNRNRDAKHMVDSDIAQIGSRIADEKGQLGAGVSSINEMERQMSEAKRRAQEHTALFKEQKLSDEMQLRGINRDLEVARFVLVETQCKGASLLQVGRHHHHRHHRRHRHGRARRARVCRSRSGFELVLEDKALQAKARRLMTPKVKSFLRQALGEGEVSLLQKSSEAQPSFELGHRKCPAAEVDCGKLHDTMSLLWGEMKDDQVELKEKMARSEQEYENAMRDINVQMQELASAKAKASSQISGSTGELNGIEAERRQKEEEARELEREFRLKSQECKKEIESILFSDICGVRQVRTVILKKSTTIKVDDVIDCEVTDWMPGECSKSCDDDCPESNDCGGVTTATRDVIQPPTALGVTCPPLAYRSRCNQVKCPVDCVVSMWSIWSSCSKECEGGVRQRTRSVLTQAKYGGEVCDATVDSESCNTGSCDKDCVLSEWSGWGGCSAACGTGYKAKTRHVVVPTRGSGRCPKAESRKRLRHETCNTHACQGDERCLAKQDLILAVDSSGSLQEEGFNTLKQLAAALVARYDAEAYGAPAMRVGVVEFGNGAVSADGTVSAALSVLPLEGDLAKVKTAVEGMAFLKGFTNMAQALSAAETALMLGGRKEAVSKILVITDGKPTFKYQLQEKFRDISDKHIAVHAVVVGDSSEDQEDLNFLQTLVPPPSAANFNFIPAHDLKTNMKTWVDRVLTSSCPRSQSPYAVAFLDKQQGFKKLYEGKTCKAGRTLIGTDSDADDCATLATQSGATFFSVGTRLNDGKCWAEKATAAECSEGLEPAMSDFYQLVTA